MKKQSTKGLTLSVKLPERASKGLLSSERTKSGRDKNAISLGKEVKPKSLSRSGSGINIDQVSYPPSESSPRENAVLFFGYPLGTIV